MKERPTIFNCEMVRAILDGSKTKTRRVIKPQPRRINDNFDGTWEWKEAGHYYDDLTLSEALIPNCPYGRVGDRIWVRETWRVLGNRAYEYQQRPQDVRYRADGENGYWRSSIYMPRWASRITLEVTDVRVERVQDISEDDARAEGCESGLAMTEGGSTRTWKFACLWNSINAKRGYGWDVNPWVWSISFRKV
jgi:hypothetical protein